MFKFVDVEDFKTIGVFEEREIGVVFWEKKVGETTHSGTIKKGMKRTDENGEVVDVWQQLLEMEAGKVVTVRWLSVSDKEEIQDAAKRDLIKLEQAKTKLQGALINGEQISLTEENQNGMAAVMQGVNLAAEMGADIFPLNFNAQTPAGFKLMTFEAAADFKAFCLTFMAERQKFFK